MTEKWWLLGGDRQPVGPVTAEVLLDGIVTGKLDLDSLVCAVGGAEWQALGEVARFSSAVTEARAKLASGRPGTVKRSRRLLDLEERTLVDGIPLWPAEAVSEVDAAASALRDQRMGFDDPEERTLVDGPLRPSDPPE